MNNRIISLVVLVLLAMTTISCQKDNCENSTPQAQLSESKKLCTIQYSINDSTYSVTIHSGEEETELMHYLMTLTRNGHVISVLDEEYYSFPQQIKETIIYRTTVEYNAITWVLQKIHNGYKVETFFDNDTGEYVCTATR
ncbi:MAG: hypothetical protein IKK04_08810 [Bacteroidales bacterium]|nr:hypothetical protein [Bacteroidales bacterium]